MEQATLEREAELVAQTKAAATQGHCSQCGKVWTLAESNGFCQWCGKQASCQTNRAHALRSIKSSRRTRKADIPLSYAGLDSDWRDWLDTATTFERHIPIQDRPDYRHDTLIELHRTRQSYGKPLDKLLQYKVASRQVAMYWKREAKTQVKVCIVSEVAKARDYDRCTFSHKPHSGCGDCPFRALRPMVSLNSLVSDADGKPIELGDIIPTERLEDMPEQWYELNTYLRGYPERLEAIAYKRQDGIPLDTKDRMYLLRYWKTHQKRLF